MPKEIISSPDDGLQFKILNDDGTTSLSEPQFFPFVSVGWSKEPGHVEIAVREGGDVDESKRSRGGFCSTLDRAQINRLIRSLRKARDQAYGSDA